MSATYLLKSPAIHCLSSVGVNVLSVLSMSATYLLKSPAFHCLSSVGVNALSVLKYCDLTPESRNSRARARRPLMSNVTTDNTKESLSGIKLLNTHCRDNEHADYSRRTVQVCVFCSRSAPGHNRTRNLLSVSRAGECSREIHNSRE
jgi:hypothetical protein